MIYDKIRQEVDEQKVNETLAIITETLIKFEVSQPTGVTAMLELIGNAAASWSDELFEAMIKYLREHRDYVMENEEEE